VTKDTTLETAGTDFMDGVAMTLVEDQISDEKTGLGRERLAEMATAAGC
jgi:hypothetical protein